MSRSVLVACLLVAAAVTPAAAAGGRFSSPEQVIALYRPSDEPGAPPPKIDLYTFEVGPVIFEKFGHAALCIRYDDPRRPPMCFNYGVTNFSGGIKLVWGFLRTQQKFWVEPELLANMLAFYRWEDRTIWRQPLPLSEDQAKRLANMLIDGLTEVGRDKGYNYDHFFDNCTTRLRDMLDATYGGELKRKSVGYYPLTFRKIGERGLVEIGRPLAFTDFISGRTMDRYPTMWEAMFLPDVLRTEVEAHLGITPQLVYKRKGPPFPTSGPFGRDLLAVLAFAFALPLFLARWKRRLERPALIWACVPLVLFGTLAWGLSIISTIPGVRWNEALFFLTPTDVAIPFLGARRLRIYARVRLTMVVVASLLCAIGVFKQPLWMPLLTVFLPMAILAFDLPWVRVKGAAEDAPAEAAAKSKAAAAAAAAPKAKGKQKGKKKRGVKNRRAA